MKSLKQRLEELRKKHFRTSIYSRLLPYTKPFRLSMALVVVLSIVQSGIALLDPWPMKILVDNGLSGQALPGWLKSFIPFLEPQNATGVIIFAVLLGVALWLVSTLLSLVGEQLKAHINSRIVLRFKADLFNHMQRLSFSYHDQTSVGDSMYRLNSDTGFISTLVWGNFRHLFTAVIMLVGVLWISLQLDWQLTLIALAAAPPLYLGVWYYGRRFKERSKRVKAMESEGQSVLQEVLSCLRVVKAFGQEEREQQRFEKKARTALRARLRLTLEQSIFNSGMQFVTQVDRSLILLIGGLHVLEGRLTLGGLLVILSYVGQIHKPLEKIGETLTDMQLSMASAERTLEVLDVQPDIEDKAGARSLPSVKGAITFDDVSFGYSPEHMVLRQVSFKAQPGEVVAIVGPTGAGKTTITSLIARFYDPTKGRVLLDGYDLRDLTIRTLRDNIAIVSQESVLFTGTIRDNIAYGASRRGPGDSDDALEGFDVSQEEIEAAARLANAHEFIMALPAGYDTQVGERGVRLSGGERQRVAIARAFIRNAPILILDEPTSSLDSRTELMILDALDRLMAGRTTFIVAHRLSTVRRADQILVINKGRIRERGTHSQLLAKEGLYAEFYRIQTRGLRHGQTAGRPPAVVALHTNGTNGHGDRETDDELSASNKLATDGPERTEVELPA
jgi:ATP-binding cassette subfamily B protein